MNKKRNWRAIFTWALFVFSVVYTLPSIIDEIDAYLVGPDLGVSDTSWDFAVVADFADATAFATYRTHPDHLAVIRDLVEPICAQRVAVQLEQSGFFDEAACFDQAFCALLALISPDPGFLFGQPRLLLFEA